MEISQSNLKEYVNKVLELYGNTPGTAGRIRSSDRQLARDLYHRGVPLLIIEQSMVLAAARRSFRSPDASPLLPVRSLHYFIPVIEEVSANPLSKDYIEYLRRKLAEIHAAGTVAASLKPP